jgi:hypothetical protein
LLIQYVFNRDNFYKFCKNLFFKIFKAPNTAYPIKSDTCPGKSIIVEGDIGPNNPVYGEKWNRLNLISYLTIVLNFIKKNLCLSNKIQYKIGR